MNIFSACMCLSALACFQVACAEDKTIPLAERQVVLVDVATNTTVELLEMNYPDNNLIQGTFLTPNTPDAAGARFSLPYVRGGARMIVTGPATLRFEAPNTTGFKGYVTLRFAPQAFPPERTAIVPHLSNGAVVSLQVSSNLVNWVSATNGIYSGTNGALFFRIDLARVP